MLGHSFRRQPMGQHKIFPPELAIDSMKDSGYKDVAHAIAELIDNSIQAGQELDHAIDVEVICIEEKTLVGSRHNNRIHQIAVYDNAAGMSPDVLGMCLAFGQGTRRHANEGMGKFGMGLPNASISQCNRVDVWSWQNGEIYHTYLDLAEIVNKQYDMLPMPKKCASLPVEWVDKIDTEILGSGTLIVWTDLDRLRWRRHKAFFSNASFIVGRMYRYFLAEGKATIRMRAFEGSEYLDELIVKPNDPLYLMENSQAPSPFDVNSAFELFADEPFVFNYDGDEHRVNLKFSISRQDFRRGLAEQGKNPGKEPIGKQCAKNQGISIVRANREIDINHTFEIPYDPVERWWGVEISFQPDSDKAFGVTNNKQFATSFKQLTLEELADQEDMSPGEMRIFLEEQEDIRLPILKISDIIISKLRSIREQLKNQTKGVKLAKSASEGADLAQEAASIVVEGDGKEGVSDKQAKKLSEDEKREEIRGELEKEGIATTPDDFNKIVDHWLHDSKFIFTSSEIRGSRVVFDVSQPAGKIKLTFNTKHPAYEIFIKHIEEEDGMAFGALKLLFAAWARMEDIESQSEEKRELLEDLRMHWGQIAKEMLDEYSK